MENESLYGDVFCGTMARPPKSRAEEGEVSRRLQIPRGMTFAEAEQCEARLEQAIRRRFAYVRIPVSFPREDICAFDFGEVKSADLAKNLRGTTEVFLFAATLGIDVDRLLNRLNLLSQAEHFITDALSSAAAETLGNAVNALLVRKIEAEALSGETTRREFAQAELAGEDDLPKNSVRFCRPRFSPGFGDLSLAVQKPFLQRLSAEKTLGITLNDALLMTPVKSITAFVGILPHDAV